MRGNLGLEEEYTVSIGGNNALPCYAGLADMRCNRVSIIRVVSERRLEVVPALIEANRRDRVDCRIVRPAIDRPRH